MAKKRSKLMMETGGLERTCARSRYPVTQGIPAAGKPVRTSLPKLTALRPASMVPKREIQECP